MGTKVGITHTTVVDVDELWNNVWADDGHGITYWCSGIKKAGGDGISLWRFEGDKIIPNPQDFQIAVFDELTNDETWYTLTLQQLAEAWVKCLDKPYTHCGGHALTDNDSCVGDIVLQVALFDEIVYA